MSEHGEDQGQGRGQDPKWNKSFEELSEEEKKERMAEERERQSGLKFEGGDEEGYDQGADRAQPPEGASEQAPAQGSEEASAQPSGEASGQAEVAPSSEDGPKDLGKVPNREFEEKEEERQKVQEKIGYHMLPVLQLPTRGLFYPEDIDIKIRAAQAEEIRHWSAMDEEDPNSIINHLNDIVASCVRVSSQSSNKFSSHKDLCDEDRFAVMMAIRALTFPKGENELAFDQGCDNCGETTKFTIAKDTVVNDEPHPDIMKYYSEDDREFVVKTKDYGEIRLKSPKLGVMQRVKDYVNNLRSQRVEPDQTFVKLLPYMVDDWRGLNREGIQQKYFEYRKFDAHLLSLFLKLTEWAYTGPTQHLRTECESCGEEARAQFRFPGSIKDLFLISDPTGQLL